MNNQDLTKKTNELRTQKEAGIISHEEFIKQVYQMEIAVLKPFHLLQAR